jgi:hypothetical protein
MLHAVQSATRRATGRDGFVNGGSAAGWTPHITVCYSTGYQPAEPVIHALGKSLGAYQTTIDEISLVIQRGAERLWDWHPVGGIRLTATAG